LPLFKEFPERLFDVGICEQHAVTFAAGLATQGIVPIVAVYSTFLQRGFRSGRPRRRRADLSVVFAMDRGGIVGDDGRTTRVCTTSRICDPSRYDLMAPKDEAELRQDGLDRISARGRGSWTYRLAFSAWHRLGAALDAPLAGYRSAFRDAP